MKQALMAVLKASTVKDCEFSTCIKQLKNRVHVVYYLTRDEFKANKLPINQAQCNGDKLQGWALFTSEVFNFSRIMDLLMMRRRVFVRVVAPSANLLNCTVC